MTKEAVILVLSCLGLVQALFLCFYLLTLQKGNRLASRFLALLLLGLTIRIGKSVLNVYLDLGPWQRNLGLSGILIAGPFLWMYGKTLLGKKKEFGQSDYFHLLPFVLFVLLCTVIPNSFGFWSYAFYVAVFIHLAVYLIAAFFYLKRHRKISNAVVWNWYRNLAMGVALIWMFYMGNLIGIIPYYIGGAIFFSLLIYVFSFLLLKRASFTMEKYANSAMDKMTSQRYITRLKEVFETEETYLDSRLNLKQAAQRLDVAPRELSQAINENEQQNFSEFVNGYRVQKAKELLIDAVYAQEKIATIAYDCGFGNVTSFNLAFKTATGLTPSQYRNQFATVS